MLSKEVLLRASAHKTFTANYNGAQPKTHAAILSIVVIGICSAFRATQKVVVSTYIPTYVYISACRYAHLPHYFTRQIALIKVLTFP